METFSLLVICTGNSPVTGEFLAQRPVTQNFDVFFDLRMNNGWVNNREAGDLRRLRAHYDVTVMPYCSEPLQWRQMSVKTSQHTCLSTVCSEVSSGWHQREHQSISSLTPFEGNPTVTGGFPSQRAGNVRYVSVSWPLFHAFGCWL